jgi:cell wall assembly regulator SMI1
MELVVGFHGKRRLAAQRELALRGILTDAFRPRSIGDVRHSNTELQPILEELDRLILREHPRLHERLRPPLALDEIDRLAEPLAPYFLPDELVLLYGWHDGWELEVSDVYRFLLPDAPFNSLAEATTWYRTWSDSLGTDGWHPLWFPAFGDRSGELVALQAAPERPAGTVYAFHSDLDLYPSYDSVAALFAATLECWQRGLLPHEPSSLPRQIRPIVGRHNPRTRTPDGDYRRTISRLTTDAWPPPWREAIALPPPPLAENGAVTIAELLRRGSFDRPVHASIRIESGSSDTVVGSAADRTGTISVVLERGRTDNFRELRGGALYELWLAPSAGGYLATRIVPLERCG